MTTMTALTDMPDADLLEACQTVADELAHYEASDGWRAICSECLRRGLQPKFVLM